MLKRDLKILQINAQSVKAVGNDRNKIVQLKTLVALRKPDVVSICETWLKLPKSDWNVYRHDREGKRGGGVLVAVRKYLNSDHKKELQ